ncbi:hypothetical protein [Natronobacterium gregoryi]|uniref:Secretion system protein n=2 Tax=Natronobacterium gregoryi TaxID=44930 RepID=L0AGK1_NATGS|nr:hypothetical protein [Natronobacterium gregoryi]AFZ72549.1 hypothetical protein Natgr_1332 [Natronobacterium gregoryi SP2]ELY74159.1 hypothetical protein C490_00620 [Natronobacterium gregoryi SP2]PLK21517.1 secretion system protein [Natronobacterium gregoryi SP2]SFI75770.1 hypothetical protein SAMN05443661_1059 [Natronobacterium gregoryi]
MRTDTDSTLVSLARGLAKLYPWPVEPSAELVESLSFLESALDPETVVRAGYGAGLISVVPTSGLTATSMPVTVLACFLFGIPLATVHVVHALPKLLAAFARTEALGDAPSLVGRVVLRMQVQPSLESAIRFGADTGHGPLSASLAAHVARSMGTAETGLLSFADEWADRFPALRRASHLLATAQDAPAAERTRTLDRALGAMLDGTREQMATFTATIRGPTSALFAFGVMLPLALVALVPAVPMVGISVNIWMVVLLYNVVLPVVLVAASLWLLVRRPVAFPPPSIDRDHPDLPDRLWPRFVVGIAAAAVVYVGTRRVGYEHLAPVAAIGLGAGVGLLAVYSPILSVRHHVRDVESHLTDALYLVGRQVAEGESVESAIALAGKRIPAETGDVFEAAASLQQRLHVGVEEAFLGEYGALQNVPSPRARGTASLLAIATDEGQPAGRAIVAMADHLEELEELERKTQRDLEQVTGTLDNTAAYFGPLVAGTTVGLADMMGGIDVAATTESAAFPTDSLALSIGAFVLVLCLVLIPLSYALRYGLDRALFGYHVGRALLSATTVYVLTVVAIDLLLSL